MRITTNNNAELIIQAKDEVDFAKARKVASEMTSMDNNVVICSECEYEMWIHLTASWDNGQAQELRDLYKAAKVA